MQWFYFHFKFHGTVKKSVTPLILNENELRSFTRQKDDLEAAGHFEYILSIRNLQKQIKIQMKLHVYVSVSSKKKKKEKKKKKKKCETRNSIHSASKYK